MDLSNSPRGVCSLSSPTLFLNLHNIRHATNTNETTCPALRQITARSTTTLAPTKVTHDSFSLGSTSPSSVPAAPLEIDKVLGTDSFSLHFIQSTRVFRKEPRPSRVGNTKTLSRDIFDKRRRLLHITDLDTDERASCSVEISSSTYRPTHPSSAPSPPASPPANI